MTSVKKNRIEHLDFLRAAATIAVVFYHARPTLDTGALPHYLIALLLNFCVPVFLMITGVLFFRADKETSFEKILKHNVTRIISVIVVWGFVYNFISSVLIEKTVSVSILLDSFLMTLKGDTTYCYQFWYLYTLVGIYLCVPIIKPWIDKHMSGSAPTTECNLVYLFFLALSIILPTVLGGLGVEESVWNGAFFMFSGYFFYTMCGAYLSRYRLSKKVRLVLAATLLLQMAFFLYKTFVGKYPDIEAWRGYTSFFTWNLSVVLFDTVIRADFSKVHKWIRATYMLISKHSFGIYIFHVMILQLIRKLGFTSEVINPWLFPIAAVSATVFACIIADAICKKIPLIKKIV